MTNAARSIQAVAAELSASRAHLEGELSRLNTEYEAVALRIAEGFTDDAKKVPALKQQMTDIRDELSALDAAGRGLQKRRAEAEKADRAKKVQDARAALPAATKTAEQAYDAVAAAMSALGTAWENLECSVNAINDLSWEIQHPGVGGHDTNLRLRLDILGNMAGKLLWKATRDHITPDSTNFDNRPDTLDDIRERVLYVLERPSREADMQAARSIKAINEVTA